MKSPIQNFLGVVNGKQILFLENANGLWDGLNVIEKALQENAINYNVLFNLSKIPLEDIIAEINKHDVLIFQTTWVTKVSHTLYDYVKSLPKKKIIIECYVGEPSWYYKSEHGSEHDVYIGCFLDEPHEFYKLTNKPYWEYKNEFDK